MKLLVCHDGYQMTRLLIWSSIKVILEPFTCSHLPGANQDNLTFFCATFYSTQRNLPKIKTKIFRQIGKVIGNSDQTTKLNQVKPIKMCSWCSDK